MKWVVTGNRKLNLYLKEFSLQAGQSCSLGRPLSFKFSPMKYES